MTQRACVEIRPIRTDDAELLRSWPRLPDYILNSHKKPSADHEHFRDMLKARLRDRDQLLLLAETDGEPICIVHFTRRENAAEMRCTVAECDRPEAIIEQAVERVRLAWAPELIRVQLPSKGVATETFEAAGFSVDPKEDGILTRKTPPPTDDQIRQFKANAWASSEAAESYERRIYKHSGVVRVKNLVEVGYAKHYATGRILDAGAGTGRFALPLLKAGRDVIALDISSEMLKIAARRSVLASESGGRSLPVLVGDLVGLPFPDDTFDSIVSITVVEHLPQYRDVLAEFVRVLKPGGTMIVQLNSAEHSTRAGRNAPKATTDYTVALTRRQIQGLLADLELSPVKIASYDLLNGNYLLERCLGRAYRPLWKSADKLLRLPLLARLLAAFERRFGSRLPPWLSRPVMIIARKPPTQV